MSHLWIALLVLVMNAPVERQGGHILCYDSVGRRVEFVFLERQPQWTQFCYQHGLYPTPPGVDNKRWTRR